MGNRLPPIKNTINLVKTERLIPLNVSHAIVLNAKGMPEMIYGGVFKKGRMGGLSGAIKADIPTGMNMALNMFKKDLRQALFDAGVMAMFDVLKLSVQYAPFWDPSVTPRPEKEGIHLQETAKLVVGETGHIIIGYVKNVLGPARVNPVNESELGFDKPEKYTGRALTLNITFYRLSPRTGFDVALYMHEITKYLENAFDSENPAEKVRASMKLWIKNEAKNRYQANQALKHLNSVVSALTIKRNQW